jgi:GT2 family glycosyltransferase
MNDVSVVITTFNRREKVLKTIDSVLATVNLQNVLELLVIDDASNDGTSEAIQRSFSSNLIRVVRCERELLISGSRNIGLREARGKYVLFLDDDVIVSPEMIPQMADFLSEHKDIACVMPMIMYYTKPELIWCAGIRHNFWTTHGVFFGKNEVDRGQFKSLINSDSVITAFMLRKSVATTIWFDSDTFPIGWEDMDFAMRMKKAGYLVCSLPWIKVWHDFPTARFVKNKLRLYFEVRNRIIFHRKWSPTNLQYISSVLFSIFTGFIYMLISVLYTRSFDYFKAGLTALRDGLSFRNLPSC